MKLLVVLKQRNLSEQLLLVLVCLMHMMTENHNLEKCSHSEGSCGKSTQDIAVYEGQRKCSANHLSYFIY
jgi:hypothetical protein